MKKLKLNDIKEMTLNECKSKLSELNKQYASWYMESNNDPKTTMHGIAIRKYIAWIKTRVTQLAK